MNKAGLLYLLGISLTCMAMPGWAQKSQDTVRMAVVLGMASVDSYLDVRPEMDFASELAYDTLFAYDEDAKKFVPRLAESWQQVDPVTLDVAVRNDVMWSDGQPFRVDDVVYTLRYLIDPEVKLGFKADHAWIKKIEKLDDRHLRITSNTPEPGGMAILGARTYIYPQHVHGPLEDKAVFGRKPVGTGAYTFVQVDKNKGLVAERNKDYRLAGIGNPRSVIGKLTVRPMPDRGTQLAEFLAGNLDILQRPPLDQALELAKGGKSVLTAREPNGYSYLLLDQKGRSGNKALTDSRVRQAIRLAINIDDLLKISGGDALQSRAAPALCLRIQGGCDYTEINRRYDPAAAKKLLSEAGYADGFDLDITLISGSGDNIAETISGHLRSLGIRANLSKQTFTSYRKVQEAGDLQVLVFNWGSRGITDVGGTLSFFFSPGPRDYHGSQNWIDLASQAGSEMDEAKRRLLVRQLFDEVDRSNYIIPLTMGEKYFLHSPELKIEPTGGVFFSYGIRAGDLSWK